MSNIKSIYIKAPKKTVNNKNLKLVVKKKSLKKIDDIKKDLQISYKPLEEIKILPSKINVGKCKQENTQDKVNIQNIKKENKLSNDIDIKNRNNRLKSILSKRGGKKTHYDRKNIKQSFSRKRVNHKRLNLKKNKTKTRERYVRLLIDSNNEVKGRMETKKKFQKSLMKMSQKQLKRVLVNKGLIKKNSKAPTKLLTDIYLNSKLMGDINVIKN